MNGLVEELQRRLLPDGRSLNMTHDDGKWKASITSPIRDGGVREAAFAEGANLVELFADMIVNQYEALLEADDVYIID